MLSVSELVVVESTPTVVPTGSVVEPVAFAVVVVSVVLVVDEPSPASGRGCAHATEPTRITQAKPHLMTQVWPQHAPQPIPAPLMNDGARANEA